MTLLDDMCEFCDSYIDPIEGDLAQVLPIEGENKLWCGVCSEGRTAKFSHLNDEQLYGAIVRMDDNLHHAQIEAKNRGMKRL